MNRAKETDCESGDGKKVGGRGCQVSENVIEEQEQVLESAVHAEDVFQASELVPGPEQRCPGQGFTKIMPFKVQVQLCVNVLCAYQSWRVQYPTHSRTTNARVWKYLKRDPQNGPSVGEAEERVDKNVAIWGRDEEYGSETRLRYSESEEGNRQPTQRALFGHQVVLCRESLLGSSESIPHAGDFVLLERSRKEKRAHEVREDKPKLEHERRQGSSLHEEGKKASDDGIRGVEDGRAQCGHVTPLLPPGQGSKHEFVLRWVPLVRDYQK